MPQKKKTVPTWLIVVGALSGIAVVGSLVIWVLRPTPPPQDSCALLAQQKSATVDIQATVKDLDIVKAKIGVTAGQVQAVDAVLGDYAAKYAASCRDHEAGRISTAEYTCKRDNMDRALESARALALTLAEVKNIADASAQRDVVLKDIETIQQLGKTDFAAGCGSALAVSPDTITFEDHYPERTVEVTNGGNRDSTYSVLDLPEAFVAIRSSGPVTAGSGVVVAIKRAPLDVAAGERVFYVQDNFGHRVPIRISIDSQNAALYEELGALTRSTLPANRSEPTVEDALAVVSSKLPQIKDEGTKYFFAAGILEKAGSFAEASKAVKEVSRYDKALYQAPSTQMMEGVINFRMNRVEPALKNFDEAGKASAPNDVRTQSNAKAFAGAVLLSQGREQEARQYLADPEVSVKIRRNRELTGAVESNLKVPEFSERARQVIK